MNIGVIGLGLIGGSFCRAIKRKTDHKVYGMDLSESTMMKANLVEAIDETLSIDNANKLDMLIIALYPQATIDCLNKFVPYLKDGAVVLDCSGNKRKVCEHMELLSKEYANIQFMGGHPMAGKEFSGFSHSSHALFEKASMLLVPIHNDIETLVKIKSLMIELGFEGVVITNSKEHDEMISYTSQLAHIVSSSYVNNPLVNEHYGFSAGSFKDMTRVAKLNPEMWTELMLDNKDYLVPQIELLIKNLEEFAKVLENKDEEGLTKLLDAGRILKEDIEKRRSQKTQERMK